MAPSTSLPPSPAVEVGAGSEVAGWGVSRRMGLAASLVLSLNSEWPVRLVWRSCSWKKPRLLHD